MSSSTPRNSAGSNASERISTIGKTALRQIRFPSLSRALTEAFLFAAVFLAAGHVSLGLSVFEMLSPMVLFVFIMMISMVLSGVYRTEITSSIMNLYYHSAYGFCIASALCVVVVHLLVPQFANGKFEFFFIFSSFFVMNTMSPLLSGTDFMDGGGRRTN